MLNSRPAQRAQRGFTLIELLIVIAISAILLAVGVPAMSNFIDRNRVAAEVNEFLADLTLTRNEALTRRAVVGICASDDGATCGGGNWGTRWIVFVDSGSTARTLDAGDLRIRDYRPAGRVQIAAGDSSFAGFYVTADGSYFNITGTSLTLTELLFHFTADNDENNRTVCLLNGRARAVKTASDPSASC